jgi:hypothetical protein
MSNPGPPGPAAPGPLNPPPGAPAPYEANSDQQNVPPSRNRAAAPPTSMFHNGTSTENRIETEPGSRRPALEDQASLFSKRHNVGSSSWRKPVVGKQGVYSNGWIPHQFDAPPIVYNHQYVVGDSHFHNQHLWRARELHDMWQQVRWDTRELAGEVD